MPNHPSKPAKKSNLNVNNPLSSTILGVIAGYTMKALGRTLRFKITQEPHHFTDSPNRPPVIFVLWHSRFFCIPPAWEIQYPDCRQCYALSSASKDGNIVARAMAVFGLGSIRGSTSRRSVAALVGLKNILAGGLDVCITPDGPRGPRYQVQPGFIKLAQSSGCPIVPVHVTFSDAWRLRTWDRFVIPKPFSRVFVTFDTPIHISKNISESEFLDQVQHLESILLSGTDDA